MPSKYLSSGTANWVASTRTISGATMTPVFDIADQTERRHLSFRIGTDIFFGNVATFVSSSSVTLLSNGVLPSADGTIAEIILLDQTEAHSYQDFIDELKSLIKEDPANPKLTTVSGGDLDKILAKAVADYSKHRPYYVKKEIVGNGTKLYGLMATFGSLWTHGYSQIKSIEYPSGTSPGNIPPVFLAQDEWDIYDDGTAQDGSNLKLRFLYVTPTSTDKAIVEFNVELNLPAQGNYNFADTDEHFSNITTLAAAYACQRLAAAYAPSIDSSIGADFVNVMDKSRRYAELAKRYMEQYNLMVFGTETPELSTDAAFTFKPIKPELEQGAATLFKRF